MVINYRQFRSNRNYFVVGRKEVGFATAVADQDVTQGVAIYYQLMINKLMGGMTYPRGRREILLRKVLEV